MPLVTHLVRRGALYHFRIRVPLSLRLTIGKNELWRSLETHDPFLARVRAHRLSSLTMRLWRAVEGCMDSPNARALVADWLQAKLDEDADIRALSQIPTADWVVVKRSDERLEEEVVRVITPEAFQAILAEHGVDFERILAPGERFAKRRDAQSMAHELFREPFKHAVTSEQNGLDELAKRSFCN